ncbi:lipopolysaccharide biosynthesis protein [Pseudovibrio exalbescens]|uniref:lipopolysaccharide biosynthesis protein n=1 Tax=Pseudovibrio exalbescens TaxID=197461 RepID=UPI0023673EFA|nr:lipopolysaccharide biosynthesis protein [Pseudovibrio exalbescens]MDD7909216.1 lipopolysaccharide biosynthesis protein [Pseudovibrio exalbescens]
MNLKSLLHAWPYVASIVLTKGLAVITIPVLTRYMAAEDVGYLDVAASLLEFIGLVFAMGLADTLFRFSGTQRTEAERNREAAVITGSALVLALFFGVLVQLFMPLVIGAWDLPINEWALRLSILGATLGGLIELPLAWLRLGNKPKLFLIFTASRGVLQALTMVVLLMNGYGIDAILIANGSIDVVLAMSLLALQVSRTGIGFSRQGFERTVKFGLPLVGGALAMFALGSCDRWFLVTAISPETLAHYSIAVKLSLAAPLLLQPFGLWWYAKRIAVLEESNGLAHSADVVLLGYWVLVVGALGTALAAPIFIAWLLPASYLPAIAYVPWLVLCFSLNELCSLLNVGTYRAQHGFYVLGVNAVGGAAAVLGYWLLAPSHGVAGAIFATLVGHGLRLLLFLGLFHRKAPIPYRLPQMAVFTGLAVLAVAGQPLSVSLLWQFAYAIAAGLIMLAAGYGVMSRLKSRGALAPVEA